MNKNLIKYLLIFVIVVLLSSPSFAKNYQAKAGYLDLTTVDFEEQIINLDGQWEFYWNQLLEPKDFESAKKLSKNYISLPQSWNQYQLANKKISGVGYATFRLHLKLGPSDKLALKIPDIDTSAKVWVNDKLLFKSGKVAKNEANAQAEYKSKIVEFETKKRVEIIVQVANFSHYYGGVWKDIKLGPEKILIKKQRINNYISIFLFGALLIMGIYHLHIYLFQRRAVVALYFSLFCILIAFRSLLTGERVLTDLIANLSWQLEIKLEYLTFYLGVPAFANLIYYSLFEKKSKLILRLINLLGITSGLLVVFTPAIVFASIVNLYQLFGALVVVFTIHLTIRAISEQKEGVLLFSIGFLIMISALIIDLLYYLELLKVGNYTPVGLFFFVLLQSLMLAKKYSLAIKKAKDLEGERKERKIVERLKKVSNNLMRSLNIEEAITILVSELENIIDYDRLKIVLQNESSLTVVKGEKELSDYEQMVFDNLTTTREFIVSNKSEASILTVPLLYQNKNLGLIFIYGLDDYSTIEKKLIINLAMQASIAINKARVIESLAEARTEAERASRLKSEFLANMSHEIRTPLNAVIGFSELLEDMIADGQQKAYLDSIKTAGKNLLSLINDILDLSKIEAGELEINYSYFNLEQLLLDMEQMFSQKANNKGLDFMLDIEDRLPLIRLDETRLRQILLNLIGNAIKFTAKGYIKITARINRLSDNSLNLYLKIEDTGIGIAKDKQEEVFTSFQQQDSSITREYEGTGLGLAITKHLTKLLNGKISLVSKVDSGSKFKLEFNKIAYKEVEKSLETIANKLQFKSAKVLVVDDIYSNRKVITEILIGVGLEVETAKNSYQALKLAKNEQFDLILLDLKLPVSDGYQVLEKIKENSQNQYTIIIAVTAFATKDEIEKIKQSEFVDYITKPIEKDNFLEQLSNYLDCEVENVELVELENIDFELEERELKKLVTKLENDFIPQYKELKKTFIINQVEHFALELLQFAKKNDICFLINYAKKLKNYATEFDLKKTKQQFNKFLELVEKVKNHS